jgi:hypothetical protein
MDALSEDTPPPRIEGLLYPALKASQKEEEIKLKIRKEVVRLKNIACEHRSHKHG